MENVKDFRCALPIAQIYASMDGTFQICCHQDYAPIIDKSGIRITDMENAWNSEQLYEIRNTFEKNIFPAICNECERLESSGLKTVRELQTDLISKMTEMTVDQMYGKSPQSVFKTPIGLHLQLNNICNCKCRICSSYFSSSWLQEDISCNRVENPDWTKSLSKRNFVANNRDLLHRWVPGLYYINFYGGETLLTEDIYELLEMCIEYKVSHRMRIQFNTNGTVYNPRLMPLLNQFRDVAMQFSIEDIEGRFEYQRCNAKWDAVIDNARKYASEADTSKVILGLSSNVSILSVYYLPELLKAWQHELRVFLPNTYMGVVEYPEYYNAQSLPEKVKKIVVKRLVEEVGDDQSRLGKDILGFARYINQADYSRCWKDFITETNRADKYRGQSFSEVYPEFWAILEDYWY
jgi:hypothetical protein